MYKILYKSDRERERERNSYRLNCDIHIYYIQMESLIFARKLVTEKKKRIQRYSLISFACYGEEGHNVGHVSIVHVALLYFFVMILRVPSSRQ